ncbi:MAG: NCS2 family permease [Bacillota bacterium]|jgi:AGZA family xanthine/uracil permease-like MFS transporter|nr:NCS2 family permease [Candidatus Fermentithermobacillaceae bacterium]HAF66193.1 guanine permease [Clostridiales bacterium UBA9857]HOA70935.1 NCS2 family permease [Bacillota bacterium]HOP71309.1 NCS2 family permease [Bacillota bacterium]HPT35587.1 NCS2 family permease [Bacillota bacterium]
MREEESLLERLFKLKEHGTDVRTEVIAGITTFMTMAYILFVNPDILSATGMPFGAVMTATALSAGITTILAGLMANYPYALASGMGLNAFFAFVVAAEAGWEKALGVVFLSGVIFLILAVTGAINVLDAAMPQTLKRAVGVGIGLFITLIGLINAGIIQGDPATLITRGNFADKGTALALIGLLITAVLVAKGVKGSILLGILITTVIGIPMGVTQISGSIIGKPASLAPIALKMDIKGALSLGFMTIFSFWFVDVFDTVGTLMGTASRAGMLDENGQLPKIKQMMTVDAIGTCLGAALGTSTVTTYVESSAGIAEGGRTGLTAVVVGVLFLVSLIFAPLAGMIPSQATAPALIIVGVLMMGSVQYIDWFDFSEAFPAFITIVMMPFAYSISDGISAGFISYVAVKLLAGKAKEIHWLVYILAAISVIHLVPGLF